MLNGRRQESDSEQSAAKQTAAQQGIASPPAISLPKGGGAIRGIGEKFAANPVTGTGSLTVPIATSPGRSGFGPQLSLSYDSGAGNGPFGFGWNLSLPSITRKTDKGLPQYRDAEESDVFILSGAEDLVPVLVEPGGDWLSETVPPRTIGGVTYDIQRYRPRIEGLFARIERWTSLGTGEIHWRSISRDNITTLYGKDDQSRIRDPDPEHPERIFSWLICESYDDKGNAIVYEYAAENDENVDRTQANERNRVRTANRYLKRIKYGNRISRLIQPDLTQTGWMFDVVFDYDEDHFEELALDPALPEAEQHRFVRASASPDLPWDTGQRHWPVRQDPFSSYRAGFEVRTYRLCRRVLMFHCFPDELGPDDYLVRSTAFTYKESPIASFITSVTQSGYVHKPTPSLRNRYLRKSLPPLEFEYSQPIIHDEIIEVDAESLENLPYGLDGSTYRWVDLDGEGLSGVLTEQGGAWFYKRNLSPAPSPGENGQDGIKARFGPLQRVAVKPSLANLVSGGQQLLDLAGDGQLDLAMFAGPTPGFYERTQDESWDVFRTFTSLPNLDWNDPNLRFVDLTGDGHADILITEHAVFSWHLSLAEAGFGPREQVCQALDEEKGPRLVFADGTQSIYLADFSGDNLVDLARVRNGEVCYWPNLGYGRFGAKVTMDEAPWFDAPDQFDQRRIRLADIDGSGTTDIIYLGRDSIDIYRNQAGNSWSARDSLINFPRVDNLSSVMAVDLLGNGTACLVWSSPLPSDVRQPMRYIDLMGGGKPHLLVQVTNNLGAETHVLYAPSTKFYLKDRQAGKPWITRLPFPVHVVERVETYDRISRNRFVTRYAYHHGYFDGIEREFRGFGMVEQWDTEEFAALSADGTLPEATNLDAAAHVPPVLTKTWFHTGVYMGRDRVSNFFAGLLDTRDRGEYYREPAWRDDDDEARKRLLDDTVLPTDLTIEGEREACRALKGSMLRQEVYALDGSDKEPHPYTVTEQNFTIRVLQPQGGNRHGVFFTHPLESISYHYERNPADPRVAHTLTLEVDDFGNVLKSAAIGYGRRDKIYVLDDQGNTIEISNPELEKLGPQDQGKQTEALVTYTENRFTVAKDETGRISPVVDEEDDYRTPLSSESCTYELTGYSPTGGGGRYQSGDFVQPDPNVPDALRHIFDNEIGYEEEPTNGKQRRLIEHVRTLYRKNDLSGPLPLGEIESLALPSESYQLAFTPTLVKSIFVDSGKLPASDVERVFGTDCGYLHSEGDQNWWRPSGQVFYSRNQGDPAATEHNEARQHFFLPRRYVDPFGNPTYVDFDAYDLLVGVTEDTLANTITAENDYRVLQPKLVLDSNRNRSQVVFDALGLVAGTAVMGKPEDDPRRGDLLDNGFDPDLTDDVVLDHLQDPLADPHAILQRATTRLVYDLFAYHRTQDQADPQPAFVYALARETHDAELAPGQKTKVQHSFSYSDGFGREIQKKIQAEPERLPDGTRSTKPRWVGSGWTVFNNKGKPVRQYEPFFDDTHQFKFGHKVGVSPILFYDPVERVIATLHPNHTWEKVVFHPWRQSTWDVNDTVILEPQSDENVKGFFLNPDGTHRLPESEYLPTWYDLRTDRLHAVEFAARYPDATDRSNEAGAAAKAAAHADTPTTAYFDTLGRTFLTIAHNKVVCPNHALDGTEDKFHTRVELDIEGNQRAVIDARGRVVMRYDYSIAGPEQDENGELINTNRIHQASMEAGQRWILNDVAGQPIRTWDSRGHNFKTEYDQLRRPVRQFVRGTDANHSDPRTLNQDILFEQIEYGEGQANDTALNLRTRVFKQYDAAGVITSEAYDFKGNLLRSRREFAQEYKDIINWAASQPPGEMFSSSTTYDALNRPVTLTSPDNSIVRPTYNEANLLEQVEANLRGAAAATPFVTNINYNARGQRTLIRYGNDSETHYQYDPDTFRLIHLYTRRGAAFTEDCGSDPPPPRFPAPPEPPPGQPCGLQNLHYTYDPAGNITHIRDDAQQTIYFRNRRVEPSNDYTYDAIYRLIKATGREHLGQNGGGRPLPPRPTSYNDAPRVGIDWSANDGNAMGRYREQYEYDEVGNFTKMIHRGTDPAHPGWTRAYTYDENSQLEGGKKSNRLTSTTIGTSRPELYSTNGDGYDPHGNMLHLPQLQIMEWDFKDQLNMTQRQAVNIEDEEGIRRQGERTYYVYDAGGQRVRKVTERAVNAQQAANGGQPARMKERIYLGGFEIYREYNGDGSTVTLERETLHIMDDQQRIALVETKAADGSLLARARSLISAPKPLIRYQFGNHLGSASLELDDQAQIISYEEYTPYGSTSYQAVDKALNAAAKRYRYTGKERDEENGFYYYGARYYVPWLGRWTTVDPLVADLPKEVSENALLQPSPQINGYRGFFDNPLLYVDPEGRKDEPIHEDYKDDKKSTFARNFTHPSGLYFEVEFEDTEDRFLTKHWTQEEKEWVLRGIHRMAAYPEGEKLLGTLSSVIEERLIFAGKELINIRSSVIDEQIFGRVSSLPGGDLAQARPENLPGIRLLGFSLGRTDIDISDAFFHKINKIRESFNRVGLEKLGTKVASDYAASVIFHELKHVLNKYMGDIGKESDKNLDLYLAPSADLAERRFMEGIETLHWTMKTDPSTKKPTRVMSYSKKIERKRKAAYRRLQKQRFGKRKNTRKKRRRK